MTLYHIYDRICCEISNIGDYINKFIVDISAIIPYVK